MTPALIHAKRPADDPAESLLLQVDEETRTDKDKTPILCKNCRQEITSVEFSTAVNGEHVHRFMNPAGIHYRIGCFGKAPGCLVHGIPTPEFTWFAGFSWCFASCAHCFIHLGWYYQSSENSFYGLILDNLVRDVSIH